MEYLQGRALTNAIGNLGLVGEYSDALRTLGYSLEDCAGVERNMGLGNGGLGRLAACFLDSIATLDLPAWGYGLRYKYGLFKQAIDPETGQQMEYADDWLEVGNPWEVKRTTAHKIGFYGEIVDGMGPRRQHQRCRVRLSYPRLQDQELHLPPPLGRRGGAQGV